jgi:hypothetical protein
MGVGPATGREGSQGGPALWLQPVSVAKRLACQLDGGFSSPHQCVF